MLLLLTPKCVVLVVSVFPRWLVVGGRVMALLVELPLYG